MHCMVQQLWLHPETLTMVMWTPIAFHKCPALCWVQNSLMLRGGCLCVCMHSYVRIHLYTCILRHVYVYIWASLMAQQWRSLLSMHEVRVQFPGEKAPLEKEMQPTPVFLPGKSHGQRSLKRYIHGITTVRHNLVTKSPPLPYVYIHK